jgi:hypothetical protein
LASKFGQPGGRLDKAIRNDHANARRAAQAIDREGKKQKGPAGIRAATREGAPITCNYPANAPIWK